MASDVVLKVRLQIDYNLWEEKTKKYENVHCFTVVELYAQFLLLILQFPDALLLLLFFLL